MAEEQSAMVDAVTARPRLETVARSYGHVLGAWFGSDNVFCTACGELACIAWDGSLHGSVVQGPCPAKIGGMARHPDEKAEGD